MYKYLCIVFLILSSCQETKKKENVSQNTQKEITDNPQANKKPIVDLRRPLFLEGFYATSSADRHNSYFIFDDNNKTNWQTKKGTGPDEGIMFYFANNTFINTLKIESPKGPDIESLDFTIYGDGSPIGYSSMNEVIELKKSFKSLFIRFGKENLNTEKTIEEKGIFTNILSFPKNKNVGIQKISIHDEDGKLFKIIPPKKIKGKVTASSTLQPELAYHPDQLFDSRKEFVWVEGAKNSGEGSTLQFDFEEEVNISALSLWNGYQRSRSHFKANARVKQFEFGITNTELRKVYMRDVPGNYKNDLQAKKGRSFTFKVIEVWEGNSYKDLAISELLFYDKDTPFILESNIAKQLQKENLEKTKGTLVEKLLDRGIFNNTENTNLDLYTETSIILRSDGTFVIYHIEYSPGDPDSIKQVADGNWEFLEVDADYAKIKIFGKLLNFSELEAYYKGKTNADMTRIFKDILEIKDHKISSGKIFKELYFE